MHRALKMLVVPAVVVLCADPFPASAQEDFPTRPVTIVVPLAAGGPTDSATRVLADELAKVWKQQVVVENKAGGSGTIAGSHVANAKPDGYTMLTVAGSYTILPAARAAMPYDTLKQFSGITVFWEGPHSIVAHPDFPAATLPELVAEARKRLDRPVTYASAGFGSGGYMLGELVQYKAGFKMKHIAYSGEAAAVPDLLAGRIDVQVATWSNVRPYVDQGKLKLLAIIYPTRLPEAPNTPTVNEIIPGGLDSALGSFNGLVVPSAVPAATKQKIADAVRQAVATDSFKEKTLKLGLYPRYKTPEETDAYLRNAISTWTEIAKATNIRLD